MGLPGPFPVVVGGRPPMGGEVDAEAFSYLFDDRVRLVLEGELGLEGLRDAPGEERLLGLRRERRHLGKALGRWKAQPGQVKRFAPGREKSSGGRVLRSEERRVGKEGVSTCRSRRSPYH